jgi:NADH-quinone oxidoreductase subunit M
MLAAYKKMFFGTVTKEENRNLPDVNKKELVALIPLTIITIWLGIYPKPVLEPINRSVEGVVQLMHEKAISQEAKERIPNIFKDVNVATNSAEEAH